MTHFWNGETELGTGSVFGASHHVFVVYWRERCSLIMQRNHIADRRSIEIQEPWLMKVSKESDRESELRREEVGVMADIKARDEH